MSLNKEEINRIVAEILSTVDLEGYSKRNKRVLQEMQETNLELCAKLIKILEKRAAEKKERGARKKVVKPKQGKIHTAPQQQKDDFWSNLIKQTERL